MRPIRSFRFKLQSAFVLLGLAAIAGTGWEAIIGASAALRTATYERLTAIAETKRRIIERYLEDAGNHVLALSTDESTISALEEFQRAWETIPPAGDAGGLAEHYKRTPGWMPRDPRTQTLQRILLVENRYPARERHLLLRPEGAGRYGEVHARFHPTLHRYQNAFGFYDIFLVEAESRRVLYTVLKEFDIGVRLGEPPFHDNGLARAVDRALALKEPETFVVEDYRPYAPSRFAPAAFFAAPIWRRGAIIGVLAIQISVEHVNRVMTGDRNWSEEGLGRTGHSYIVGPDGTLRSDVRFEIEQPEEFYTQLARAGIAPEIVGRIRQFGTAILNLHVPDALMAEIRAGDRGTHAGSNFRGSTVLRSIAPLRLPGLDWTLVAEIEASEALEPISDLRRRIAFYGILTGGLFFMAAAWLGRSVTRPVMALSEGVARIGQRDFAARLPVESEDEIGQLATAFNRMADDLRRTTVSKEELEVLAGRLLSAQEEERSRIGRELHDDLTQRLAALAIELGRLERGNPELTRLKQQVVRLSQDVHGLSRRLHPAMLEELGLVAAIESECRGFFERGGAPVDFVPSGDFEDIGADAQLGLYRIVQEGLRNVQKHSGATEVHIRLRREEDGVHLEISDNGQGFHRAAPGWRPGLGLASMEERARLLGGRCTIHSRPGEGTRIEVHLPGREGDVETESAAG